MPDQTILDTAANLVNQGGDRNNAYDHPWVNFAKISIVWSVNTGHHITPENVADMMIGLKNVRESFKPAQDNLIDTAGYARCKERFEEIDYLHRMKFNEAMAGVVSMLTDPPEQLAF